MKLTLRPAREETFDFRIHGAMITRPGAFSLMLAVHDGDRFSRHEDCPELASVELSLEGLLASRRAASEVHHFAASLSSNGSPYT